MKHQMEYFRNVNPNTNTIKTDLKKNVFHLPNVCVNHIFVYDHNCDVNKLEIGEGMLPMCILYITKEIR